jgi:membrane associated rhomboid family serine protease
MFPIKDNIPLSRLPVITIALVLVNAIVYLLAIRHGASFWGGPSEEVFVHHGAIPHELTHPGMHALLTAFSSLFLHGSLPHLLTDMLFLAIFGPTVEDRIGRPRFLAFYLLGGLIALGAQTAMTPNSTAPALGSSGAIAAILGGYILLHPRARVLTLVLVPFFATIVEVPVLIMLALWSAGQLWLWLAGLTAPLGGAGFAYLADAGAFLFGLLAIRPLLPRGAGPGPRGRAPA